MTQPHLTRIMARAAADPASHHPQLDLAFSLLGTNPLEALNLACTVLRQARQEEGHATELEVNACRIIGIAAYLLARYEEALERLQQARQQYVALEDRAGEASCVNNIGNIFFSLGDFPTALEYYLNHLAIREDLKDEGGQASALNNIGNVMLELQDAQQALSYHQEALERAQRAGLPDVQAAALCNIGMDHHALGDLTTAIGTHQAAVQFAHEVGEAQCEAEAYANLGQSRHQSGDYLGALGAYEQGLEVARQVGDRVRIADVRRLQALTALVLGELGQAHEALREALLVAEGINARKSVYEIHLALSDVALAQGDPALALTHYRTYHAIEREVLSGNVNFRMRSAMLHLETEKRRKEHELLLTAHQEKERLLQVMEQQSRELERLAHEDPLTGLLNRRSFELRFAQVLEAESVTGQPVSVIMVDIDHFKRINDTFGHGVGDQVLRAVADTFRQVCRGSDFIARYGGEEFAIVLPGASLNVARRVAERILEELGRQSWVELTPGCQVSASFGVATSAPGLRSEKLLQQADQQLYLAKQGGRSRVVVADSS